MGMYGMHNMVPPVMGMGAPPMAGMTQGAFGFTPSPMPYHDPQRGLKSDQGLLPQPTAAFPAYVPGGGNFGSAPPNPLSVPHVASMPTQPAAPLPQTTQPSAGLDQTAAQNQVFLVYNEEMKSMEEKRAELERYWFDEDQMKLKVSRLNSAIESRLGSIKSFP